MDEDIAYDEGYEAGTQDVLDEFAPECEEFLEQFKTICAQFTFDPYEAVSIRFDAAQKAIILSQGGREEILR